METNVFGVIAVTKGCIPTFRSQKSGKIVNISSTSGISGNASMSLYAASKFALEGASECLAAELAPFNIRVLIVEPGGMRTNFQAAVDSAEVSEPYKGTPVDQFVQRMRGMHGKQAGDPEKAGHAIVEVVTGAGRGKMPKLNRVCRLVRMLCRGGTQKSKTSARMSRKLSISRSGRCLTNKKQCIICAEQINSVL